MVLKLIR